MPILRKTLSDAVEAEASSYLTTLRIEPLDYEVGHIDIGATSWTCSPTTSTRQL